MLEAHCIGTNKKQFQVDFDQTDLFVYPDLEFDDRIDVTVGGEVFNIVWEYISPYWGKQMNMNMVYRAFRVPCSWVPQLDAPPENPVTPLAVSRFRVPGAAASGERRVIEMAGVRPYNRINTARVLPENR